MRYALLVTSLTVCMPAWADEELTPQKVAKIERDKALAMGAIEKKYGNKQSSELTSQERRAIIDERAAAERLVFEKNGVSAKAYVLYTSKMSREDRAATQAAEESLQQRERAAETSQRAQENPAGPTEIPVQRGFNDSNPVVLEEQPAADPIVDKSLPQEARDDQAATLDPPVTSDPAVQDAPPAKTKKRTSKKR